MLTYVYIFLSTTIFSLILPTPAQIQDKQFWELSANEELKQALKIRYNEGKAKNVIIFVGDGMGVNTVTASRIYRAGEESLLFFETFPHVGMLKTYATDMQVPDSACTATALFCGVKSNYETLGVSPSVKYGDCPASLDPQNQLNSIMVWAQNEKKSTGIVTTTRITHATPAATYARSAARHWETNTVIPKNATACKDIARQLFEDSPGKNFKVILGGGLQCLVGNINVTDTDPIEASAGLRTDGVDLIKTWINEKKIYNHLRVKNTAQLKSMDHSQVEYLLGIFTNSHMPYHYVRDKSPYGVPSLSLMATSAVKVMLKNKNGFVLMVEGGMIDQAHHIGAARIALDEVLQFNDAVNDTVTLLEESGILDETLIIVTSDHGHSLSINGYPKKGNSILGVATKSKIDGVPWTTLTYAVGSKQNYQFAVSQNGTVIRQDPSDMNTSSYDFRQQALAPHDISAHGGGDVIAFAKGPMAHLIHSVHEQNYIAHVIAYASKIGPYANLRDNKTTVSRTSINRSLTLVNFIPLLVVFFLYSPM